MQVGSPKQVNQNEKNIGNSEIFWIYTKNEKRLASGRFLFWRRKKAMTDLRGSCGIIVP